MNPNVSILVAGCSDTQSQSDMDAQAKALLVAVKHLVDIKINIKHLFTTNFDLHDAIILGRLHYDWRANPWINLVKDCLTAMGASQIHIFLKGWDVIDVFAKVPVYMSLFFSTKVATSLDG